MKIAIGSENPVKVAAVQKAFGDRMQGELEFFKKKVPSLVPDQPFDDQIQDGAQNRALEVQKLFDADFGVGLEGGITKHEGRWYEYAWCAIADRKGNVHFGHSFGIEVPDAVMKKILEEKKELGDALDEFLGTSNIKQKEGFFGFATGNRITRESGYYAMICAALAPITLADYYKKT